MTNKWRLALLLAVPCLLLYACTDDPAVAPTFESAPRIMTPSTTTADTVGPTTTSPATNRDRRRILIESALPDGTTFEISMIGERETPTGFGGVLMYDDGFEVFPAGSLQLMLIANQPLLADIKGGVTYSGSGYLVWVEGMGGYFLEPQDPTLAALGEDAMEKMAELIELTFLNRVPVLEVAPPFRWATAQDQLPNDGLETRFTSFVVREGCGDLAVVCSSGSEVQLISADSALFPAPTFEGVVLGISADPVRSWWEVGFMEPGPLKELTSVESPYVGWTGSEMIVFGGRGNQFRSVLGAAYDPKNQTWRRLPNPPFTSASPTAVAFGRDRMYVVTRIGTFSYVPSTDSWIQVGEGVPLSVDSRDIVANGSDLFIWDEGTILGLGNDGQWTELPLPSEEAYDAWEVQLHAHLDGLLFVSSRADNCGPTQLFGWFYWDGDGWSDLTDPAPGPSGLECSSVTQTAVVGDRLLAWGGSGLPLYLRERGEGWAARSLRPLHDTEGWVTGIDLGGRLLLGVVDGEAAIYDPLTDEWVVTEMPGDAEGSQMVWTGDEILAWTSTDAWRWTPPPS